MEKYPLHTVSGVGDFTQCLHLFVISFKCLDYADLLGLPSCKSDLWRRYTCTNALLVCEREVGELGQPLLFFFYYSDCTVISNCTHPCDTSTFTTHSLTRIYSLQMKIRRYLNAVFSEIKNLYFSLTEISILKS